MPPIHRLSGNEHDEHLQHLSHRPGQDGQIQNQVAGQDIADIFQIHLGQLRPILSQLLRSTRVSASQHRKAVSSNWPFRASSAPPG